MKNDLEVKWAIYHICESIQKRSGTRFSAKEAMNQVFREIRIFGHDTKTKNTTRGDTHEMHLSRFTNWITRFHVSHRFKVMMNMNGIRRNKIY